MRIIHWCLATFVTLLLITSCTNSSNHNSKEGSKLITAFTFNTPPAAGEISETNHTVKILVPYGTDITTLIPQIAITGISISPASGTEQDFTEPIVYTVTAEDLSTQDYIVTVTEAAIDAKKITSFIIQDLNVIGNIVEDTHSIFVTVPYGTDASSLTPTILLTGESIAPASEVTQDFTSPLVYIVTAADHSEQDYTATVVVSPPDAKAIASFRFANIPAEGVITEATHDINITVPYGTDLSELIPTIQHTGTSISPESGEIQDFSAPLLYTVMAGDSTTQDYTITVSEASIDSKSILKFNTVSPLVEGVIEEDTHSINLTMPNGTDINSLTPHVIHSGISISPALGVAQDFTSPVVYTVTAADNSTQDYLVSVVVTPWAACGDSVYYEGQNYSTVQIGSQCWFAENLNIGTQIPSTDTQGTDCTTIEKYCYDNDPINCNDFGGLYAWPQAMCTSVDFVESSQGICPDGWHVPSSPEYAVLVNHLSGYIAMPDYGSGNPYQVWYGSPAGDRMKAEGLCQGRSPCADTGFNASMNGEAYANAGEWSFIFLETRSSIWTSSLATYNSYESHRICLSEDNSGVCNTNFYSDYAGHAFAIRCVKD